MALTKSNGRPHMGIQPVSVLGSTFQAPTEGALLTIGDFGLPCLELVAIGSGVSTEWTTQTPQMVHRQLGAVSCDGTNNTNTLYTVSIPGGVIGLNGSIRLRTVWTVTGSTNSKRVQVKLGGSVGLSVGLNSLTTTSYVSDVIITNRGSLSSQVWAPSGDGPQPSGVFLSTENTANAKTLLVTGRKDVSGETMTLEYAELWKMK